jgi:hypothetical protein
MDRVDERGLSSPEPCRYLARDTRCTGPKSALGFRLPFIHRVLELVVLLARSDDANEIELVALRHEVAALRRQVKLRSFAPADRALFAALGRLLPLSRWACFSVTPATLQHAGASPLDCFRTASEPSRLMGA